MKNNDDVSWLFLQMTAAFSSEWTTRYPPKKTRVVKSAKLEWGRVISGYNRDELSRAISLAKGLSTIPPSTMDFWKMLESRRVREREIVRQQKQQAPPDKNLGVKGLRDIRSILN